MFDADNPSSTELSLVQGSTQSALWNLTLGQLADQQAGIFGTKDAIIVHWSSAQLSFQELSNRSKALAKGLLSIGIQKGDYVGIFSSDDERLIELLFAVGRIGAVLVVLNKTYTVPEAKRAIESTGDVVNRQPTAPLVQYLQSHAIKGLERIVLMRPCAAKDEGLHTWEQVLHSGHSVTDHTLRKAESVTHCKLAVCFQFTSGTTGTPKAAMLSHFNIINNARFIGERLSLIPDDIICCPPPLFHCFGLVAGMLASVIHGASVVFPQRDFDASAVLEAVVKERCTVLHGVPTMLAAVLQEAQEAGLQIKTLRTGIAAGTKVSASLLAEIQTNLGYRDIAITYGMTETSPASFMTEPSDTIEQKLESVGKVLPHVAAKVVDGQNRILPLGQRGELCVSGYLLQQGYYKIPEKTAESMIRDENGRLWMHTGDEAFIDKEGYCYITGRIKDIIIRGGENINPTEIEDRLMSHTAIAQACVVGLNDAKYGEVVGAFLRARPGHQAPSLKELRYWVGQVMGQHKAPSYIFRVGTGQLLAEYPTTGSGKIRKDILREVGNIAVRDVGHRRMTKI